MDQEKNSKLISTETLQAFVASLVITLIVYIGFAMPNEVLQVSMLPTFQEGDLIITDKAIQWLGGEDRGYDYEKGDIVVFRKRGSSTDLIKRIIATEGDTIKVANGKVYLNDEPLEEPYLNDDTATGAGSFLSEGQSKQIPEDSYIVMGDNRSNSRDSRFYDIKFVERSEMRGRVIFRYWPLSRFGKV